MRAVPSIWPQHFYSGPSLARDDRVESRACNLGWTPKEEVWSPRCTKTCLTLQSSSLCKVMSPGSACFLGSFDPPWAQTCLLPSEPVNPQLKKFDEKMLFISEWWTLFTFLFCSPFQQDDKVQSRPCNFGRDRKKCLEFGMLLKFGMLLTKKHVCYKCPNHLQPSRFGSDNVQLGGQCLQSISVGSRIWLYQICLIGEHFWPKIFLKIVSA